MAAGEREGRIRAAGRLLASYGLDAIDVSIATYLLFENVPLPSTLEEWDGCLSTFNASIHW